MRRGGFDAVRPQGPGLGCGFLCFFLTLLLL